MNTHPGAQAQPDRERIVRASVIIPAYNAEEFIARAIDSVLTQTEQQLEIIVIDDASTDATAKIAAEAAARDPRIHFLRSTINSGPGAARNRGLECARGDWIILLDADDEFAVPYRIERLITLGEQHGADVVSDNLLVCFQNAPSSGEPMLSLTKHDERMSLAEFVAGNIGSRSKPRSSYGFMQPAFRRAFLQKHGLRYDGSNRFGEDFLLYVACLLKGARWWVTPEPMYRYTVRTGSLTEVQTSADLLRIKKHEEEWLRHDPMIASDLALTRVLRQHKALIARRYYYRAFTDAVKSGAYTEAFQLLLDTPSGFCDIILESLTQAPTIIAKAIRGGYRKGGPARPRRWNPPTF
jgi:succinoglycan biosynthesis protein ExoO